jgi:hypothetical protein
LVQRGAKREDTLKIRSKKTERVYECRKDPNDKDYHFIIYDSFNSGRIRSDILEEAFDIIHLTEGEIMSIPSTDMTLSTEDKKDTNGKYNPLLMPVEALKAYSAVSDYGNKKYGGRNSWKLGDYAKYCNAAARHLFDSTLQDVDSESGLPHCYATLWNACAAVWHYEKGNQ